MAHLILFLFVFISLQGDLFCYFDPGTNSLLLQICIGLLASALYIIKVFWKQIKMNCLRAFAYIRRKK